MSHGLSLWSIIQGKTKGQFGCRLQPTKQMFLKIWMSFVLVQNLSSPKKKIGDIIYTQQSTRALTLMRRKTPAPFLA
jgi:hypothetical protein